MEQSEIELNKLAKLEIQLEIIKEQSKSKIGLEHIDIYEKHINMLSKAINKLRIEIGKINEEKFNKIKHNTREVINNYLENPKEWKYYEITKRI